MSNFIRILAAALCFVGLICEARASETTARAYPFEAPPLAIYDRLAELRVGAVPKLADDERALLGRVWEMKSSKTPVAVRRDSKVLVELMLIASGIQGRATRDKYIQHFDRLVVGAKRAVKSKKDDHERGEALMKFLHDGVMKKGYDEDQTSFATVLDTGEFNCVSSTAMYGLIGARLGLKLQAIAIPGDGFLPGHATLDMLDRNERIQVEPTNPDGFDWETKIKQPGVIVLRFIPDRAKGYEIDELGVAASIYSNRGVALAKDEKSPRPLEAAVCYLAALCLDPTSDTAANNLLAVMANWGGELSKHKQFEEATRVLAFGLSLDPKRNTLQTNQKAAWGEYIQDTLKRGNDQAALEIIARSGKAIPSDRDFQEPSRWFITLGETQLEGKDWKGALAVADRGLQLLTAQQAEELKDWRTSVIRRWSQDSIEKSDFDASLQVLTQAYAADATNSEIMDAIALHTQEALKAIEAKSGTAAMLKHYQTLRQQFPNVAVVAEVGNSHAQRMIAALAEAKKFQEAIDALPQYRELASTAEQQAELAAIAYDGWARDLASNKKWPEAADVYAEGLKAFPKQERLEQNALATIDEWAGSFIDAKNWDEAIRIYKIGLEGFPGTSTFENNLKYCEEQKSK